MDKESKEQKLSRSILITIVKELGSNQPALGNLSQWELQDLILKDIHIRRILSDNDKKEIKRLKRELMVFSQVGFKFSQGMKRYE